MVLVQGRDGAVHMLSRTGLSNYDVWFDKADTQQVPLIVLQNMIAILVSYHLLHDIHMSYMHIGGHPRRTHTVGPMVASKFFCQSIAVWNQLQISPTDNSLCPHVQLAAGRKCTWKHYFDGLVQERRNSIGNALELRLPCTKPSICHEMYTVYTSKHSSHCMHCVYLLSRYFI